MNRCERYKETIRKVLVVFLYALYQKFGFNREKRVQVIAKNDFTKIE